MNEKMLALGKQSSVIRALSEYGTKRKSEIGAENVYDFSLGNPSIPAPETVKEALFSLTEELDPCVLHGYTASPGDFEVRSKIATSYKERFGFEAKAELIYMTCGAAASLTTAFHALLNQGEEVVVPAPFFPEYRVFVEKAGGVLKPVLCHQPSFQLNLEKMEEAITEKTRIVLLNSPNNPTGAVYSEESIKALSDILTKKEKEYGRAIYLLADEPYRELYYGKGTVPFLPLYYPRTLVAYSFSKSLSLPGERIGYLMVSPAFEEAGEVFRAICGAGRSLGFVCAPSLWQRVISRCLGQTSDVEEYRENCAILSSALSEMGYVVTPPEGAFYLFIKVPDGDAATFSEKAKNYELLLVPSDSFGVPGFVRASYCVSRKTILDSLPAFEKLMKEYK